MHFILPFKKARLHIISAFVLPLFVVMSGCQTAAVDAKNKHRVQSVNLSPMIVDPFYGNHFKTVGPELHKQSTVKMETLEEQYKSSSKNLADAHLSPANTKRLSSPEVYEQSKHAVVKIATIHSGGYSARSGIASGFFISDDGILVTNHHVLSSIFTSKKTTDESESKKTEKAGKAKKTENNPGIYAMTFNGDVYQVVEIFASSRADDLAIMKVDTRGKKVPFLPLGDTAPVGSTVHVLSHPVKGNGDGLNNFQFTRGMVSRHYYERKDSAGGMDAYRMSITADYAAGSSGAPLIDEMGNTIGVVSATRTVKYHNKTRDVQMVNKISIPVQSIKNLLARDESQKLKSANEETFTITGKLEGITGKTVSIRPLLKDSYSTDKKPKAIASADIINGQFTLTGTAKGTPRLVTFNVDDQVSASAILENGKMQIQLFKDRFDDKVLDISMTGSPLVNAFQSLANSASKASTKVERARYFQNYISAHPDSDIAYAAATRLTELSPTTNLGITIGLRLSTGFHREVQQGSLGKSFGQLIDSYSRRSSQSREKNIKVGDHLKDFSYPDINGKTVTLSKLVKPGQYVFLDFWASWCGPCRVQMPKLVKAYNKYHKKGLEMVLFSIDDNEKAWKEAIKEDEMPDWINLRVGRNHKDNKSGKGPQVQYEVNSIPSNFLIDGEGKIIDINLRGEEFTKKIQALFN